MKKQILVKSSLTLILYSTLLHQINIADKSRAKALMPKHLNKLSNSCNKRSTYCSNSISFIKSTVNNMSSYTQTVVANAVAFGLDHHIPTTKILTLNLSSIFNTLIAM